MNRDLLLRDVAESGYNIGYAAKKHLATYDVIEKAPGWISLLTFAVGIGALVIPRLDNKFLAAIMLVVAYGLFYFTSYQDGRLRYAEVGSRLTTLFTNLRSLYYEIASRPDGAPLEDLVQRYRDAVDESQRIGISKQIFLSDWYAHYKFFWQAERSWLQEKRPFTFWRDQMPLSATVTAIVLLLGGVAFAIWRMI